MANSIKLLDACRAAHHQLVCAFGIVRSHASADHIQHYQRAMMLCEAALAEATNPAPAKPDPSR